MLKKHLNRKPHFIIIKAVTEFMHCLRVQIICLALLLTET